jgi:hypothetical protein
VKEIDVRPLDPGRFNGVLESEPAGRFACRSGEAADRRAGRRLWHVNSTAEGGGTQDQITHDRTGVLLDDPSDLAG